METPRTHHDAVLLISSEISKVILKLGNFKSLSEIYGTEAYPLLDEYQKRLTTMHNEARNR